MMKTLILPAQVIALAFNDGAYVAPETITEQDVAAAEQRYIIPVIGAALYEELLVGRHADFLTDYLTPALALFVRLMVQPRLDVRCGSGGATAPRSTHYQPASEPALRSQQRAIRMQAQVLVRRAVAHLEQFAEDFPAYKSDANILNRCSLAGGVVM